MNSFLLPVFQTQSAALKSQKLSDRFIVSLIIRSDMCKQMAIQLIEVNVRMLISLILHHSRSVSIWLKWTVDSVLCCRQRNMNMKEIVRVAMFGSTTSAFDQWRLRPELVRPILFLFLSRKHRPNETRNCCHVKHEQLSSFYQRQQLNKHFSHLFTMRLLHSSNASPLIATMLQAVWWYASHKKEFMTSVHLCRLCVVCIIISTST